MSFARPFYPRGSLEFIRRILHIDVNGCGMCFALLFVWNKPLNPIMIVSYQLLLGHRSTAVLFAAVLAFGMCMALLSIRALLMQQGFAKVHSHP